MATANENFLSDKQPSNGSGRQRVFPLHLTPFEKYMHIDDRSSYPMTFIVEFEFEGELHAKFMREAIEEAIVRHPLLSAIIRPAKQNLDCWVQSKQHQPFLWFGSLDEAVEFPNGSERIDLRDEPGLRMWVRHNEDQTILTTQFHHAVCDGIGAYQFLGDVLLIYSNKTNCQTPKELAVLSPGRLRGRAIECYNPQIFRTESGNWQNEWKYLLNTYSGVASIRPRVQDKTPDPRPTFPGIVSFEFDKNEHRLLRLAAQSRGQTVNDLLMEKLFVTLNDWQDVDRRISGRGAVCVMMPLDLREPNSEKASACNIVTYAFIRRKNRTIRQTDQLIGGLREEVAFLKHNRHRSRFMNLIVGAQRHYPWWFKFILRRNRSLATAVLSNTGDPTKRFLVELPREKGLVQCGNLSLTQISGVPPMRIKTRATISVFTYRRVLKICLRCDPNLFDVGDTQTLLDEFVSQIKQVLVNEPPQDSA